MGKTVFVIDDEKDLQKILKVNLSGAGYDARTFSSAEEALMGLESVTPDLIILDIMMGGMDGYEFCRRLRSNAAFKKIPVIFLSAKSEEFDKVLGLELGGDDYMSKPFSIKELLSRVKAVLRRTEPADALGEPGTGKILKHGDLELNPDKFLASIDGKDLQLTKSEFLILNLFMEHPGKVFTRDNIINSIRGDDVYVIDRTIDVHIMNIRKKLGPYKKSIKTLSGIGYGFKE
jgi:two-component system phosphate regulon response regulator PhoB